VHKKRRKRRATLKKQAADTNRHRNVRHNGDVRVGTVPAELAVSVEAERIEDHCQNGQQGFDVHELQDGAFALDQKGSEE
jgi:hypothetical protein